jgi:hypothetical protein
MLVSPLKKEAGRIVREHKPDPRPSTFQERMKIMARHSNKTSQVIDASLKRRARLLITNSSIPKQTRSLIRYALEIKDPDLAQVVRRIEGGEMTIEHLHVE